MTAGDAVDRSEPPGREADAASAALGTMMLAFDGHSLPTAIERRLATEPAAGLSLFRALNVRDPGQVRDLTEAAQAAAGRARPEASGRSAATGEPTLLVAADQEGGQLIGLGEATTPFAGNMALGAVGDPDLAERVARATGLELRAMGVNVVYAPNCDLATNPDAVSVGIRSFGDDPTAVAGLAAATVRGLASAGVAATVKHFPGGGAAAADPHHGRAVVEADGERLRAVELAPFRAGIAAGARLVMAGHLAVPAITGRRDLPATLAPSVLGPLLRDELGFDGLVISDALDMGGLAAAERRAAAAADALSAGVDLLLCGPDEAARLRIEDALRAVFVRPGRDRAASGVAATARRLAALRAWLGRPELGPPEDPSIVGCAAHRELARELAERSLTLVRDDDGRLPLDPVRAGRVLVVEPQPTDQTPADTSSTVAPGLATAIRDAGFDVTGIVVGHVPGDAEIAAAATAARAADTILVGTTAAHHVPAQGALARALLALERPTVTIALRTPFDLVALPASRCHVATYGILPPTLTALAGALAGRIPCRGRLPAAVPGLHPTGHGLVTVGR